MTACSDFSQKSDGGALYSAEGKGSGRRNRKSLALSALLSATALGVFLEGCGGGGASPSLTPTPSNSPDNSLVTPSVNIPGGSPGDGRSVLRGSENVDILSGGEGRDLLEGLGGNDVLDGGDGDDILRGGDGDDILRGGDGNDRLEGGSGADEFFGGEGLDIVSYKDAPVRSDGVGAIVSMLLGVTLVGDAQGDTFHGVENLEGSAGNDALSGDAEPNDLYGLAGEDNLHGMGGKDRLYGGDGADTLLGGEGNDRLEGGDGDDKALHGEAGMDTILGGEGADTIDGGEGEDILEGGAGADVYIFHAGDGKDLVREVVEAEVVNILRFVGTEYQFATDALAQVRFPSGISFLRDGRDLTIFEGVKDPQGSYSETHNEVVLEGYYTTETGEETVYTLQVQYNDAAAPLHDVSYLMSLSFG